MNPATLTPYKIGQLPNIAQITGSFGQTGNAAASSISTLSTKHLSKVAVPEKKINIPYLLGATGASLEVVAGLFYIVSTRKWASKIPMDRVAKPLNRLADSIKGRIKSKKFKDRIVKWQKEKDSIKKVADATLAGASCVALPMEISAAVKSEQPGMMLSSALWAAAVPSIFIDLNTRTKGLYSMAYAPSFASFANEINNDFRLDKDEKPRKQKISWKHPIDTLVFAVEDQLIAAKTAGKTIKTTFTDGIAFIRGKTEKPPEIFSTKPSKESMSLASTLVILGSLPKLIMGKKIDPKILREGGEEFVRKNPIGIVSDLTIGSGMIFDSLGMMSLANQKNDSRRTALLVGGPMRIVGDFRQQNPFMYGLRTMGGASCMYYWAGINKEKG